MIEYATFDKMIGTSVGNYRLEQFVGQARGGPVFLARTDAAATYLLHILAGPTSMASRDRQVYLERFHHQASQLVTLQHPNILSLLDYGSYHGLPYLVSPYLPMRSLHSRLDKNGPLDIFTIGRYLDQITATLEYAHQHGVLHSSLSVDCIFIRLDGQLVVADFGVRSLLLTGKEEGLSAPLTEWDGACAPEQLLGKPVGTYTDVYALGTVLFALLTGAPVFAGTTAEEIAQQHLYASVPPLSRWRNDLPAGLYSLIARALSKDPGQRFRQPGALANAYHRNVAPGNRIRVPFVVVSEVPTVQTQEPLATGPSMVDKPFAEHVWNNNRSAPTDHTSGSPRSVLEPSVPHSLHGFSDDPLSLADSPRAALMHRFGRKDRQRAMLLIAALVALLMIASTVMGIALLSQKSSSVSGASGQVTFFSNQNDPGGQTNALHIAIQHLEAPPAGYEYEAWIINDQTEQVMGLGRFTEKSQTWSLSYSGASGNLLEAGDKLEITQEQGVVKVPAGKVILVGTFPVKAFQHIQHLLVGFPETPGKIGMLMGLLQQTHLLNIQASVLQSVIASRNTVAIECVTQSMLDIIEGTHGTHYQPLAGACTQQNVTATGDGFGLLGKGYVAGAEEHASLALSQPDATSVMHLHAGLMDIGLSNITTWVTTIEQDVLHLRAHPTNLASIQEITTLADDAYHGVDVNGDGQIDPVVGEAGALTAYLQGQLMATLSVVPGT